MAWHLISPNTNRVPAWFLASSHQPNTPPNTQKKQSVNQSLSELACVMSAMKHHKHQHGHGHGSKKPAAGAGGGFRDSALTALLRSSLGGDCKVRTDKDRDRNR